MRSLVPGLTLLLATAVPVAAATFLTVASGPDEPMGRGQRFRYESPLVTFGLSRDDFGGFHVFVPGTFLQPQWRLAFIPQDGGPFTPGEYEGIAELSAFFAKPGVRADGPGACTPIEGRFVLHEVEYAGDGIVRFAADVEQRCAGTTEVLRAHLRVNAGDEPCDAGPNGTSCDDRDACSPTSACHAGRCVGTGLPACAEASTCHEAGMCDPSTGACLDPGRLPDGVSCDDADACTGSDDCRDGVCVGWATANCFDGRDDTYDSCDPAVGCDYPEIPGTSGAPGVASTLLFLGSAGDEPLGTATRLMQAPRSVVSIDGGYDGQITFSAQTPDVPDGDLSTASVRITPPPDGPLLPGVYEDVSDGFSSRPGTPGLTLFGTGLCEAPATRLVVHEHAGPAPPADAERRSFAADFETRCTRSGGTVWGALRWRAGDVGCDGAVDGTPCDDHDACTGTSACRDDLCVGADPVICGAAAACDEATVCDPRSGACVSGGPKPTFTPCSDPARCVSAGHCTPGGCVAALPPCDDENVCTTDRCDGAGTCEHAAIDGTCWGLRGTTTITASALGASCTCTLRGRPGSLALFGDGTFARPGGTAECSGIPITFPPERGVWEPSRRSRLTLRTTNLDELLDAASRCDASVVAPRSRLWVKMLRNGTRLRGLETSRSTSGSPPVKVRVVTRFNGRPTSLPEAGQTPRGLDACARQLARCLRDEID